MSRGTPNIRLEVLDPTVVEYAGFVPAFELQSEEVHLNSPNLMLARCIPILAPMNALELAKGEVAKGI
jgi:hypothetical protein